MVRVVGKVRPVARDWKRRAARELGGAPGRWEVHEVASCHGGCRPSGATEAWVLRPDGERGRR